MNGPAARWTPAPFRKRLPLLLPSVLLLGAATACRSADFEGPLESGSPTLTASPASGVRASGPNLVVVMTDDQGFGDFGVFDHPVLRTPRLDAFRAECPIVDRFYVSPVCSPTRASLMTGRYPQRTGVVDTYRGRSMMDPDEVTLAEVLRAAGYRTGLFGKWHLGDAYPLRAMDQGFDTTLVHRGGGLGQPSEPIANEGRYTDPILFSDGEPNQMRGYCTDVFFDAALSFMDESVASGTPFLAVVTPNAPHAPLNDVPPREYAHYRDADFSDVVRGEGVDTDAIARTFAMVENIDTNFGRLLDHLDARGLADDTLVVFLVDNGPTSGRSVAGLRGYKTSVYEGGIRSPLLARWPGRVGSRATVLSLAAHIDLFPTLLDAAGVGLPDDLDIDGRSLLPQLEGRADPWSNRQLFVQAHRGDAPAFEHQFAVIESRWKLLRPSGFGLDAPPPDAPFELYDLDADPSESTNIAGEHPSEVARLRTAYAEWFRDVAASREGAPSPPRIIVGSPAERLTTLTHQDWVVSSGKGWGDAGQFHLQSEAGGTVRIRALPGPGDVGAPWPTRASLGLSGTTFTRNVEPDPAGWPAAGIDLGVLQIPAGPFELNVTLTRDDETWSAYQLELETEP